MPVSLGNLLRTDFKWAISCIKYLGIYLPGKVEDIFPINFPPLLTAIKIDLASWQCGLFSWFGQCNIVKMKIIPQLLHYFQALPIHIMGPFLRVVNRALVTFL